MENRSPSPTRPPQSREWIRAGEGEGTRSCTYRAPEGRSNEGRNEEEEVEERLKRVSCSNQQLLLPFLLVPGTSKIGEREKRTALQAVSVSGVPPPSAPGFRRRRPCLCARPSQRPLAACCLGRLPFPKSSGRTSGPLLSPPPLSFPLPRLSPANNAPRERAHRLHRATALAGISWLLKENGGEAAEARAHYITPFKRGRGGLWGNKGA